MAFRKRQAERVSFALREMKLGFRFIVGPKKPDDLDKLLNSEFRAGLKERPRPRDMNGFKGCCLCRPERCRPH